MAMQWVAFVINATHIQMIRVGVSCIRFNQNKRTINSICILRSACRAHAVCGRPLDLQP